MLEHTKLVNVIKNIQICFDPNEDNSVIEDDNGLLEQYYEFEKMINESTEEEVTDNITSKSKWIIRMEFDPETLLEKNITMDDINFAINSSYGNEVSCVYSDYNSSNLIFRIRMNNSVLNKRKTKGCFGDIRSI